ncbi:MAG TPA: ATP-binding protein, partial [Thermodesulfobacteriota bacterium]|nr:ATP-binding protein [Thermodesulfobacteriota bacterium]
GLAGWAAAAGAAVVGGAVWAAQQPATTVPLPWFVPTKELAAILAGMAVAACAAGYYRARGLAYPLLIELGFLSASLLSTAHLLTFPDVVPGLRLASTPSLAAYYIVSVYPVLAGFLIAAATGGWARAVGRRQARLARLATVALTASLVVALRAAEEWLPVLIRADGSRTPALHALGGTAALATAVAVVLHWRGFRRTGDPLMGYVALAASIGLVWTLGLLVPTRRFAPFWYLHHTLRVLEYVVMLFGLLSGYEALYRAVARSEDRYRALSAELERRVAARTAQLELANRELEAFSYSVSHDLRAPLRSIDGFSQALLEDYEERLDADGREHLRRVRAASQRMAQLIDDLLGLARVARSELRREAVDLSALARDIVAELRGREPERPVVVEIADGLVTRGDPRLLRLALENLLGNAWKFTRGRTPARIAVGVEQGEGEPAYFVRDNGAGFDMAYAGKLFGPFQRLHAAAEFEGNGIGLATVQRIVHRHGGRVWATGAVGQGATFYFTLRGEAEACGTS